MPTLRTTPSDRDATVRRRVADGATDADIAAELGVAPITIARDRQRLGLLRRPPPAAAVSDDRLREAHAKSLDNAAIGAALGLTRRTVQERLHRLGLRSHRAPR